MALFRDKESQRSFPLRAHHTIGRCAERADTVVSSPIASRIHLAIEWDGVRWQTRDLSKNGTWLGGNRLAPNENTPLQVGDTLHLGAPEMAALEFLDASPPSSLLLGTEGAPTLPLEPFTFLPDKNTPEAVVIYSHAQRSWVLQPVDQDAPTRAERALRHGDSVSCGGRSWQIFLAESELTTEISGLPENTLADVEFVFDLSQDEENTELHLEYGARKLDLGERSHHYLLLHLARLRAVEAAEGYDIKTQGWIDNEQLKKDLGLDMPHVNIMIFRAHKRIAEKLSGNIDSELLIERGKGRMRFGGTRCRIYKGDRLAYSLPGPARPGQAST